MCTVDTRVHLLLSTVSQIRGQVFCWYCKLFEYYQIFLIWNVMEYSISLFNVIVSVIFHLINSHVAEGGWIVRQVLIYFTSDHRCGSGSPVLHDRYVMLTALMDSISRTAMDQTVRATRRGHIKFSQPYWTAMVRLVRTQLRADPSGRCAVKHVTEFPIQAWTFPDLAMEISVASWAIHRRSVVDPVVRSGSIISGLDQPTRLVCACSVFWKFRIVSTRPVPTSELAISIKRRAIVYTDSGVDNIKPVISNFHIFSVVGCNGSPIFSS